MLKSQHILLAAFFLSGTLPLSAQVASAVAAPKLEIALTYSPVRSNAPPGGCACFWMQGATAEFSAAIFKRISIVGKFSGNYIDDLNTANENLGLVSYLFGPRYSFRSRSTLVPFGQVLVGGAHGFDSLFPIVGGSTSTANSFAASAGGGLDIDLSRHLALRALQADYFVTHLPNDSGNWQNNLRLGAGIVFRIRNKK